MSNLGSEDEAHPLLLPLALRVDEVCWSFEAAWKAAAAGGEPPRLETYLAEVPEPARAVLLRELIQIEAHHLRQAGNEPRGDDCRGRLPGLDRNLLATLLSPGKPEGPSQSSANSLHRHSAINVSPVPGYELLGVLGSGGMGVVYQARQLKLNRMVALKMIQSGLHIKPRALQRFQREAEAVAQLQHPNIVQIHEVGEHNGRPYLALEFVSGGNLDQRLGGAPQPAQVAARLVQTLAQAVQHAHERGVLHRDIKPANILLAGGGGEPPEDADSRSSPPPLAECVPKITDFGLAKLLDDDDAGPTRSGDVLGTPGYMAPEQAQGKPGATGPATDIYGLGALLYELLTGRPPFSAETVLETLLQVRFEEPVSPSQLQRKCPRDLVTICLKCLQKEPARRYASARELADDLGRFLRGEPIRARPAAAWERVARWVRRRPAAAALLVVSVLAAAALIAASVSLAYNARLEALNEGLDRAAREADAQRARAESEEGRTRRVLYCADLMMAHRSWEEGDVTHTLGLLGRHGPGASGPEDLRGFEWRYLQRLCRSERLTLDHPSAVLAVAYSPDGRLLASGSANGQIRLWDADTGRLAQTLGGSSWRVLVHVLAFSPDGRFLASGDSTKTLRLWEVESGQEVRQIPHPKEVLGVAFSPDGRLLASASPEAEQPVVLWDPATGKSLRSLRQGRFPTSVAFSPDGLHLAAGCRDGTAAVWDVKEDRPIPMISGHSGPVLGVALAPGRRLITASADETVRVWDATSGRQLHCLRGHAGPIRGVALDPSGKYLASGGGDGLVKVWDLAAGVERLTFRGHGKGVRGMQGVQGVAFHPRGRFLASAGGRDNTVKVWDTGRAQEALSLAVTGGGVTGIAFGPGGHLAASTRGGFVRVWEDRTGAEVRTLEGRPGFGLTSVACRPDGRHLAAGSRDGKVLVWDAKGQQALSLSGEDGPFRAVAYSPDGRLLAGAADDGKVRLWDADTGKLAQMIGPHLGKKRSRTLGGLLDSPVACVAFSPDGRLLASAAYDQTVRLWDVQAGRPGLDLEGHAEIATGAAFSPDGRLLVSASEDRKVKVWEVASGRCLHTLEGQTGEIHSVSFSPDGRRVAAAGADPVVMMWDVATGQTTLRLRGHTHAVYAVAFSPDGRLLVSASADGTVRVWDAARP